MPRTKQTKRSNPPGALQLLPPLPSGRRINDERKRMFSINDFVRTLTAAETLGEKAVFDALEDKKIQYIDWWSRHDDASQQEERFIRNAINKVEGCNYQLIDVFGDGNCLFYCLLLLLRMNGEKLCTHPATLMNTFVMKLRKELYDHYEDHYKDNESKSKNHLFMLDEEGEEFAREKLGFTKRQMNMAKWTRVNPDEIEISMSWIYDGKVEYVTGTPENNFDLIVNNMKPELELPDIHLVARLFVRKYEIPLVYVVVEIKDEKDIGREDNSAEFTFYIYNVAVSDPTVRLCETFPTDILEKYSHFIIAQYCLKIDNEQVPAKVVYDGIGGRKVLHHKFLVTSYTPPVIEEESENEEEDDISSTLSVDDDDETKKKKNYPMLTPGHVIQFHMPSQRTVAEFYRIAIVYKTDPSNKEYPISTSYMVPIPASTVVKIVGRVTQTIDVENKNEAKVHMSAITNTTRLYLYNYRMQQSSLNEDERYKCDKLKLNIDDFSTVGEAQAFLQNAEQEAWDQSGKESHPKKPHRVMAFSRIGKFFQGAQSVYQELPKDAPCPPYAKITASEDMDASSEHLTSAGTKGKAKTSVSSSTKRSVAAASQDHARKRKEYPVNEGKRNRNKSSLSAKCANTVQTPQQTKTITLSTNDPNIMNRIPRKNLKDMPGIFALRLLSSFTPDVNQQSMQLIMTINTSPPDRRSQNFLILLKRVK